MSGSSGSSESSVSLNSTQNEPYRPKTGEILVKDSIIYSQKPGSRQLRRQLWPIMEETMHTIAHGMATGAKLLKHMVRPNLLITGDPKYFRRPSKALTIKNVYLGQPSPLLHNRQVKPFKLPPTTVIVKEQRPVRTTSEDYILRYNHEDPSYTVRTRPLKKSPYADMGVTGYKHFEKTVLRELEEKEERKVEESMFDKSVEQQLLDGTPFADWKPMSSASSTVSPPTTEKPHAVSRLNTITVGMEVKPVHEVIDETPHKTGPNQIESVPVKLRTSKYAQRKPSKPTVVATVAPTTTTKAPAVASTTLKAILEVPNYPDFFIKQNKHLTDASTNKPRHFSKSFNAENGKSHSFRHAQNIGSSSNQQEVYVDPQATVTTARPRRVHRHRAREPSTVNETKPEKAQKAVASSAVTSSRGRVKFGDRAETE